MDNTRALFERTLTEDANRKSAMLWERYLAFEFEMGDLQSALRLEKRAREALGETGSAGAGAARNMQLLLLRYEFLESWPCPPGHKQYLAYLLNKGPAPPGFDKQRRGGIRGDSDVGDRADRGREDSEPNWRGSRSRGEGDGADGTGAGGPAHEGQKPMGGASLLDRFLHDLPKGEYLDGPLPDLNLVVDTLMGMEDEPTTGRDSVLGFKREYDGDDEGVPGRDVYRMRAKQRARMAGDG